MGRAVAGHGRRWGLAVGLVWMVLAASGVRAAAPVLPRDLAFDIVRKGEVIGWHTTRFSADGDRLDVAVEIRIKVTFAGIALFRYEQDSHEVWTGGRLIALDSRTNDDGDKASVTARADGDRLRIDGQAGRIFLPGDAIPTSYWNHALVDATTKIDTERGIATDLQVAPPQPDTVALDGKPMAAQRYEVTGRFAMTWWYLPDGEWAKLEFRGKDGTPITYVRRSPAASAAR
jgi:hypothetical protein